MPDATRVVRGLPSAGYGGKFCMTCLVVFFFSSRRRHTRLVSDWSSDVCSSDLAMVRRWIGRYNRDGLAGLADRPRCGRPSLGGRRLARRIAALLERPGPWTLPRI